MSVDYRIKICRKVDDECLGICNANQLKNILDSEYSGLINCDSGRNCDKVKFTKDDLLAVTSAAFDKIKDLYKTITEKKLMLVMAQNVDIKHELEEEIFSLNEEIEDQTWPIASAYELAGLIDCVVEDLWDKGDKHPAYKYNGFDLLEKTVVYANGDKETSTPTVWCEDVYCIVEANY